MNFLMRWPQRGRPSPAPPRLTAAVVLGLVGVVALASVAYTARVRHEMRDFEVYWQAGQRAAHAEPLYRETDGHYQFKYLPAFAIVAAPLAALPLPTAKAVWFGLSVILLATVVIVSLRLIERRRQPVWLLALGIVVVLGKFYGHELVLGQTNLAMTALILIGTAQLLRGHDLTAGLSVGAAVLAKPYAILLLPYLIAIRRFRAAGGVLAVMVVGVLLTMLIYGPVGALDLHWRWLDTIVGSSPSTIATQDNVSLFAMFAKWLGTGTLATTLAFASIGVLAGVVARVLARRPTVGGEYLEVALVLTLLPLVSPQGWDYVLVLATPGVVLTLDALDRLPRRHAVVAAVALVTMGLSLFDLMGRAAYAAFMNWSVLTLCALVLVAMLSELRARQLA